MHSFQLGLGQTKRPVSALGFTTFKYFNAAQDLDEQNFVPSQVLEQVFASSGSQDMVQKDMFAAPGELGGSSVYGSAKRFQP
jgi:hypothetical protein